MRLQKRSKLPGNTIGKSYLLPRIEAMSEKEIIVPYFGYKAYFKYSAVVMRVTAYIEHVHSVVCQDGKTNKRMSTYGKRVSNDDWLHESDKKRRE